MRKKITQLQPKSCPSCGAPIVSEICEYCGMPTGLSSEEAHMEYPLLECKEASIGFWTVAFPAIFAGAFGLPGLILLGLGAAGIGEGVLLIVGLPFFLIGTAAAVIVMRTVLRYVKVKSHGQVIRATVYGYMDDQVLLNDRPAQIVKLLVQTSKGPRFILYQLGTTLKPYGIHDKIDIMVYQDYFLICRNKETVF